MGGDLSIVMVAEKQTITQIYDFENPVTFKQYRILYSADLKNLDYHKQVAELLRIKNWVEGIYRKEPLVIVDSTGNEGLSDTLRLVLPGIRLYKFSGDMIRERGSVGRYHTLNKPVWVQKLALLLEQNRILIDKEMPAANEIKKQLESFAGTIRTSGSVSYEARQGHDDYISCMLLLISAAKEAYPISLPPCHIAGKGR
jgi:hypothetical protein